MSSEDKGKMASHRDRYWSVMLVGDHGRVIPFRHFKGLAIGICIGFILMFIAIVVMAVLYTHQMKKMASLQSKVSEIQLQNSKLRDEKDLYLTRLMLTENQRSDKNKKPVSTNAPKNSAPAEKSPVEAKPKPQTPVQSSAPEHTPPEKEAPPKVKWMADIRMFSVSYDTNQQMLKAQFRIYNISKPKKPLSGRSVIVFKNTDNPTEQLLTVPQVTLVDGVPPASKGQAFQIRNYFTMRFRAYRQIAPIPYNTVTAYVFSTEGNLLASKEMAIKIEAPAPPKSAPQKTATERMSQPPVQTETGSEVDKRNPEMIPSPAPATPKSDPATPKSDPATPKSDPATPKSDPATPKLEKTPGKTLPPGEKKEGTDTPAPEKPVEGNPESTLPSKSPGTAAPKESEQIPQPSDTTPKP